MNKQPTSNVSPFDKIKWQVISLVLSHNPRNVSMSKSDKTYKHIFFDLDHTIWDFDKNAEETLHELYEIYRLGEIGLPSAALFIETYTRNNHQLWAEYHTGKITKTELRETRFKRTFIELGVHPDVLPVAFEDDYVKLCPTKTNLFPHAHETLQYLQNKY